MQRGRIGEQRGRIGEQRGRIGEQRGRIGEQRGLFLFVPFGYNGTNKKSPI